MLNQIYVTEDNKLNFLKGLINLAKVDGVIEENEIAIVRNVAISMGLDAEKIENIEKEARSKENEIKLSFDTKQQSLLLIREGIQLCYVDGKYDEKEKEMIKEISSQLDISWDSINRIEEWVKEGIAWSNRGLDLLNLEV